MSANWLVVSFYISYSTTGKWKIRIEKVIMSYVRCAGRVVVPSTSGKREVLSCFSRLVSSES